MHSPHALIHTNSSALTGIPEPSETAGCDAVGEGVKGVGPCEFDVWEFGSLSAWEVEMWGRTLEYEGIWR